MNTSEFISVATRPYSTLLKELTIFGKLFSSRQLAFNMQPQTQTNWCWAATSTSVSHFYWALSSWTQCLVANAELSLTNCCNSMVPTACNVPWFLDRALTRTQNFVSISGPITFQQVRDEIDAGRPVGTRIGWSGGGGHFMAIYGYSLVEGVEYFDIDDPIYGKSHLTVADFSSNYQGSGSWTHAYLTKSYFKMPIKELFPVDAILHKIWEARPLLKLKQDPTMRDNMFDAATERATIGMAQRVYSLSLDSLLGKSDPAPQPVALRVHELAGGQPSAFFDVTETDQPRVLQMSASRNYLDPFTRALAEALTATEGLEHEAEIRLFRVPALNFEALWINHEGGSSDLLIPLRPVGKLVPYQTIPFNEALEILREAAAPLAQMDDTMGA
ncbi:MAG: hypothetical protein QOF62_2214 [Pyrinomonadaceae bacterium]|nr:hypothetical protein [Pyrinomonadaceae bacterium]